MSFYIFDVFCFTTSIYPMRAAITLHFTYPYIPPEHSLKWARGTTRTYLTLLSIFVAISLFFPLLSFGQGKTTNGKTVNGKTSQPQRSQTPIISTSAEFLPFRIGLMGSLVTMPQIQTLTAITNLGPPLIYPFRGMTIQGYSGGLEAEYNFLPWLALGVRGEYERLFAFGETERLVPAAGVSTPNDVQGQAPPRLVTRRTTLTFETTSLGLTPLLRFRPWSILTMSLGVKMDIVYTMPLRYQHEAQDVIYLNNLPPVTVLRDFNNFPGRDSLVISPVLGLGATLNVGRFTFIPEVQLQTQYRPFTATNWTLIGVRGNLSILFNFSTPSTTKPDTGKVLPNLAPEGKTATTQPILTQTSSSQTSSSQSISLTNPSINSQSISIPQDTIIQRDTTVRLVAWNEEMRINQTERLVRTENGVVRVFEQYSKNIPKSRPFLVADLSVRFVPTQGASRASETTQASRLQTHRMIIRRLVIDSSSTSKASPYRVAEQQDTLDAVRMPTLRFLPEISGELGIESSVVEVFSPEGGLLERFAVESKRTLDWDMQHIFLKPHNDTSAWSLNLGKPLRSLLTATDAEGQIRRSDTVRIVIESSGEKTVGMLANTRSTSMIAVSARPVTRSTWLVTRIPVPFEEDAIQSEQINQSIVGALITRLPRGKQQSCALYVNAVSSDASALQYAQNLAAKLRISGLQSRIIRRAQSINSAATVDIVIGLEEK